MPKQRFKLIYVRPSGLYVTRQEWQLGLACLILLLVVIGFLVSRPY